MAHQQRRGDGVGVDEASIRALQDKKPGRRSVRSGPGTNFVAHFFPVLIGNI